MQAWETLKLGYDPAEDNDRSLSMSEILEFVDDMKMKDMVDTYNSRYRAELRTRGKSTVLFPPAAIKRFFSEILQLIKDHVQGLLAKHAGLKYIFLVGGFGECKLLEKEIKQQFQTASLSVITPMRPGLAVLRGAVQYGFSAKNFVSRKARFTYGVLTAQKYDSCTPHQQLYGETLLVQDILYLQNMFSRVVETGQTINCDETVTRSGYTAACDNQSKLTFYLYSFCGRGTPTFTTDQGCTKIGQISCSCNTRQTVDISFKFGVTELQVEARNTETNEKVSCILDYGFGTV